MERNERDPYTVEAVKAIIFKIADTLLKHNPFFVSDKKGAYDILLHQTETVARALYLKPTRMLLADVIGLGKTITALRIASLLRNAENATRILIVTPSTLVPQWVEEASNFFDYVTVIESPSQAADAARRGGEGVYIISMDRLKKDEYFQHLSRIDWDVVIVDEAHKLRYVGRESTQRFEKIARELLFERLPASNIILLTATPHRGYDEDYIRRLMVIDPSLTTVADIDAASRAVNAFDSEFYASTHNVIVHRRTKEDVNSIYEGREVFKPCKMIAVLVTPTEEEKRYLDNIVELGTMVLRAFSQKVSMLGAIEERKLVGVEGLLTKLLIKRGLSSPKAALNTLEKISAKRALQQRYIEKGLDYYEARARAEEELKRIIGSKEYREVLEEEYEGDIERELDDAYNILASSIMELLGDDPSVNTRIQEIVEHARKVYGNPELDSKLAAVTSIIEETMKPHLSEEFRDLTGGKVIIFTEFRDTAEYVYANLRRWITERCGSLCPRVEDCIRIITSKNKSEILRNLDKFKAWLKAPATRCPKILVATDVLAEGLNLQDANIIINYEITYSPVRLEQRLGRVWRYGQNRICYVFNLFYVHRFERHVFENLFRKLYGITEAIQKSEVTLGEKVAVYTSEIRGELLEKVVDGQDREFRRLLVLPLEVKVGNRRVKLTETEVVKAALEEKLHELVDDFIKGLRILLKKIREKRILPDVTPDIEKIKESLRQAVGIGDIEDALELAGSLTLVYNHYTGDKTLLIGVEGRDHHRFLAVALQRLHGRTERANVKLPVYFLTPGLVDGIAYLGLARVQIDSQASQVHGKHRVREYVEPVLVVVLLDKREVKVLRGKEMLHFLLFSLLPESVYIDETYNVDYYVGMIYKRSVEAAKKKFEDTINGTGRNPIVGLIHRYENTKKARVGAGEFFWPKVRVVDIEPIAYFITVSILPENKVKADTGVTFHVENETIRIVEEYERANGRTPDSSVRFREHYDVESCGEKGDTRYIEVKTGRKTEPLIEFTEKEYETASRLGDKYWLYLVYGLGTEKPVILCIRNPVKRLSNFEKVRVEEVRYKYVWMPAKTESSYRW